MSAATTPELLSSPDHYFVPQVVVEVEGQKLDPETFADVIEVKVVLDITAPSSVDLKLSNFDHETHDLKWSDSKQFQLGSRLHVQLGYVGALFSTLRGPITTLSPEFPADGPPTLTVRAMDPIVALKDSQAPDDGGVYRDKQDWEIVQEIAERHDLRFVRDTTVPGPKHARVVQGKKDDFTFILERAARLDFRVFMHTDPKTGESTLHFGSPTDGRDGAPNRTYVLAWGTLKNNTGVAPSLIEFKPSMSSADQVQSVTVTGWDAKTKRKIEVTAKPAATPGVIGSGAKTGPSQAGKVGNAAGRKEVVTNAPVETEQEATELAQALLAERAYKFMEATGKVIGLPDLRPGDNVEIHGVGERFGGSYFITQATHTLNASGLLTEFKAHKTFEGSKP